LSASRLDRTRDRHTAARSRPTRAVLAHSALHVSVQPRRSAFLRAPGIQGDRLRRRLGQRREVPGHPLRVARGNAMMMTPVSAVDPFSLESLTNPYPFHEELREAGPVVWLERYGIWAMARHEDVRASPVAGDPCCPSGGGGRSDSGREMPGRPRSLIPDADPPLHTRTRAVLTRILSAAAMKKLWATFEADAIRLVDQLVERGSFDAVKDLAEVYPLKVFPDAVGLAEDGRENLLPYGNMAFNAFGPQNDLFRQAMANAQPVVSWIMSRCQRAALAPGGLGAQIYAAADAGELTEDEASLLVRSFLTAGLDTTVVGLGNAMFCFVHHPDQWERLRQDPSLARAAFEEVLRYESPV